MDSRGGLWETREARRCTSFAPLIERMIGCDVEAASCSKQKRRAISSESSVMKLLQIHTFYGDYLRDFYERKPGLEKREFQEQVGELVEDGFSGSHLFPPPI